jgi:hypothetical protein
MGGARKLVTVVQSGLADELRDIRDGCGLSLDVVCTKLRWQQSKLSRMENGQQCISDVDLGALLAIYEVHGEDRRLLLHLAERQDDPGRWELDSPTEPGSRVLMRLEPKTTAIVDVEPLLVPGLVQTEDYIRAVMKCGDLPPDLIDQRVAARRSRNFILTKPEPTKFDMIVDEIALRRVTGNHKIMARQLRAMLEIADLPNVRLWVVPFERGAIAGLFYPFYLMDFHHGNSVVMLESQNSGVFLEDKEKIDFFRRYAAKLTRAALDPAKSMDRVATLRKEHERE